MQIVIVEDDINMRKSLEIALGEYEDYQITSYKSATQALKKLDSSVDLIITDINMPKMDGIEFITACEGKYDFIIMTGNATLNRAIESVRLGVKDFLVKPFDIKTLVTAINRCKIIKEKTKAKPSKKIQTKQKNTSFLGSSPALEKCLKLAYKGAQTDASVMLFGESGVGKELFAKYIHESSKRSKLPFIAINMAAIPANLIESELFGYEKGAFTDAVSAKKGLFELASGGTLFLDEIAEMPFALQAKLLRALQEKEITRLGALKPIKIDVRIVSATNANIKEQIANQEFRADLYYRLNTLPICIPPLKERKDEILEIAQATLANAACEYDLGEKSLSIEAKAALLAYDFPGNIRELISIVQRAAILSENKEISADDLFLEARAKKDLTSLEKELINQALFECENDDLKACKLIGMSLEDFKAKACKYGLLIKK